MSDETPFCFIYTTMFKKVKLRFPFTRFERELLTELDIAPAQLHPNSWAFVRAYQILCAHLGFPVSVDVFLYLFEAKNPGDRQWVSLNRVVGRSILSIFQQSYKDWKGKFVRVCCSDQDPALLDGFPLYWVNKGKKDSSFRELEKMGDLDRDLCGFWKRAASSNVVLPTSSIISYEFLESQLDVHIGLSLGFLSLRSCRPTFTLCIVLASPTHCLALLIFLCLVDCRNFVITVCH